MLHHNRKIYGSENGDSFKNLQFKEDENRRNNVKPGSDLTEETEATDVLCFLYL